MFKQEHLILAHLSPRYPPDSDIASTLKKYEAQLKMQEMFVIHNAHFDFNNTMGLYWFHICLFNEPIIEPTLQN
jgi:hypothetical protein